jgi:hypothetical protein
VMNFGDQRWCMVERRMGPTSSCLWQRGAHAQPLVAALGSACDLLWRYFLVP